MRHAIPIDWGKFSCALGKSAERSGHPQDTGYLNHTTGEIVFLHKTEGDTARIYGEGAAIDSVFDRGRVASEPDEWLEIPKYDGELNDDRFDPQLADLIEEFFQTNGIYPSNWDERCEWCGSGIEGQPIVKTRRDLERGKNPVEKSDLGTFSFCSEQHVEMFMYSETCDRCQGDGMVKQGGEFVDCHECGGEGGRL